MRSNISRLREKMILHEFLFNGKNDDFNHLVKFESHIAYYIQYETQHSIVLHIGRLLDGHKKVFSFKRFITDVFCNDKEKISKYLTKLSDLKKEVKKIIDWRNLMVAHENYECAFDKNKLPDLKTSDIVKGVDSITEFFCSIERELKTIGTNTIFEDTIMKQSISRYVKNVKRGNTFQQLQMIGFLKWNLENEFDNMNKDDKRRLFIDLKKHNCTNEM